MRIPILLRSAFIVSHSANSLAYCRVVKCPPEGEEVWPGCSTPVGKIVVDRLRRAILCRQRGPALLDDSHEIPGCGI